MIIDNIYLISGENKYELECFIKNKDNQYCKIKDFKQLKSGKYTLNIPERIQKIKYAVKVINTQEFTINQLIDLDNLQTSFEFDLAEKDIITISIPFIQ